MTQVHSVPSIAGSLLALFFVAQGSSSAYSGAAPDPELLLVPGVAEFELEVGASRRHAVRLDAGQVLDVEIHENGPRVVLSLVDAGGATLARREAPAETLVSFRLMAIATATGSHVLEVRSSGEGRAGRYQIRVGEPRTATDADRARVTADDALAEAVRLATEADADARGRALGRLDAAEAGFRDAGDRRGQALALLKKGRLQFDMGQSGADAIDRSLALFRELGDEDGQGAALLDRGTIHNRQGAVDAARTAFEQAARHARASGNPRLLSVSMSFLGITYGRTGEAEKAVELFTQALSLATEAGSPTAQGRALNNLGIAYKSLGELQKSLESYERAHSLYRGVGRRDGEALILGNIANLYMTLADDARAFTSLEEALAMSQKAGLRELEARNLNNLAKVLSRRGEHDRAIELGRRSLELRRLMRDRAAEAASLHTLGRNLHRRGDMDAGRQHLDESLRIQQAIRERYAEVDTLAAIAGLERDRGNLPEALAQANAAVVLTEELRSAVTNPDLRASFVANEQDVYGLYIDLLMRQHEKVPGAGHDAAALQLSERARARVLLEALIEARADIREGVEPSLLDLERALQKRLSEASARLSRALTRDGAAKEATAAQEAFDATAQEYRQVQSKIRRVSPRYAALTQPVPATVEEIRRELLGDDTVLLEFYLGEQRSFVWAVTRSELVSQALPGRAQIEATARTVHDLMTQRQRTRDPVALRESDRRLETESAALSRLLWGRLAPRLATEWKGKRLLIVASGALAFLPLGALPSPVEGAARPLLGDHEIVFAPSASVLIARRREQAGGTPAGDSVAVLADPVFDAADPRVSSTRTSRPREAPRAATGLTRAIESRGRGGFTRLPFSRGEANAIATLVPRASLLKATDFAANRALVAQGSLGDRRVVHFATHGLLDSEHPDLSGLVLSLVDEKGVPQDGFLRMHEIYNLRLPVDLVVLSACQTALGREIRGEGLVGLTRGFMYAGARSVVASLWQVDDESTAELMSRFYRAMLKDGRRPPDALRAAQLEMSKSRRWSSPFYWAGFVLQGEWRR